MQRNDSSSSNRGIRVDLLAGSEVHTATSSCAPLVGMQHLACD